MIVLPLSRLVSVPEGALLELAVVDTEMIGCPVVVSVPVLVSVIDAEPVIDESVAGNPGLRVIVALSAPVDMPELDSVGPEVVVDCPV